MQIPTLILFAILTIIIIGVVAAVFLFGLFRVAEKEMGEKVVSEEETERRRQNSDKI